MKISDVVGSKDNNYNLIRFIAALVVFINHCFPLTGQHEPFGDYLGMTMGTWAVDIFFITSGFLVTNSLIRTKNAKIFLLSRIIRIYPGLIAAITITIIVIGACFTSLSIWNYLKDTMTIIYFVKGTTLLSGVGMYLPGTFESNPFPNAVNGSLWTLIYEVKMYIFLLLIWLTIKKFSFFNRIQSPFALAIFALMFLSVLYFAFRFLYGLEESHLNRLAYMFFSGAFFYLFKDKILLSHKLFGVAVIALITSVIAGKTAFTLTYVLVIPYILFYIAYVPKGSIRLFNRFGDYSYGIYIYAFPVQQALVAIFPEINTKEMMIYGALAVIPMAMFSWHLIEKNALKLKSQF